jgi:ABC-type nickel/cobalt efflux system permease component RcnA
LSESLVLIIAAVLLLGIGLYKLWNVIRQSRKITASKDWPVVTAQVTKKEVVRRITGKGKITYFPELDYKYSVMGSEFNQHTRLRSTWSNANGQKTLDAVGDTLEVHYNPEKPKEHTNGYEKVRFTDFLVIVVTLGMGVLMLVLQSV